MMATTTTMVSEVCGVEHEVVGMSFVIGDATANLQEYAEFVSYMAM